MFESKMRNRMGNMNGKVMTEHHYGAGVNNIGLKSAFASFDHTKLLYDVKCAYCQMKIKAEKPDGAVGNSPDLNGDAEAAACRLFADSVAECCFRNGFQNFYHTYEDRKSRYFVFAICPVSWFDGSRIEAEHFIGRLYPHLRRIAENCGYEGLEVARI